MTWHKPKVCDEGLCNKVFRPVRSRDMRVERRGKDIVGSLKKLLASSIDE